MKNHRAWMIRITVTLAVSLAACARPGARLNIAVDGKGTTNPPAGSRAYASGTAVQVTAIPVDGATFDHWSGAATGSENPVRVVADGDQTLVAHFSGGGGQDSASSGGGSSSNGGASSGGGSSGGGTSSGGGSSGSSGGASTVSIDSGGEAAGGFLADAYFSGGTTYSTTGAIDASLLPGDAPPASVLQTERYGEFTYTIPDRTPGTAQSVTLYFEESHWTAAGQRTFDVAINGATVLSAFDIFQAAGGANRAIAKTFETTADASGQVVIRFVKSGQDNPKVCALTVTGPGSSPGGSSSGGSSSGGSSSSSGAAGPQHYSASWASVDQHPPAPEWFQDAKFGLWHHWGAFAQAAFGSEWYPRNIYNRDSWEYKHHLSVYGDPFGNWPYHKFLDGAPDKAGVFTEFAPKLKSEGGRFDPDEWAQLFVDAGARMAGPVSEHHDGFSMWRSTANEWNSVDKGPNLDLTGLFAKAYRAKGLKFMVSTHTAFNFTGFYQWVPAQADPSLKKLYGQLAHADEEQLWLAKEKELIDLYQPDYMWHDFGMNSVAEATRLDYLSYYFNKGVEWGRDVVVSYNDGFNENGEIHQIERGGMADLSRKFWLSEDTVSLTTWGYTEGMQYYSARSLLHALIDRVSKNGFLLLNTSPMADGTFPQEQKAILLTMGAWLKKFGEAIYSTRAWVKYGEGPTRMGGGGMGAPAEGKATDIRFTRSKDARTLYAIELGWPAGDQMVITSLRSGSFDTSTIQGVSFVGGGACAFTQDASGLKVTLPPGLRDDMGYAVKITFGGTIPAPR